MSSSTPQDPYGTGDEPDRSSGSTPPPYGGDTPSTYGSNPPAYGSTPPTYGSSSSYSTPPAYGGADYGTSQPQYGYGYPKNSLAVWSLVLGLVGLFVCGLFAGIPAIIVGHKARKAAAEGQANNAGMATAGIVLGWISTILTLIGIIIVIGLIATGSMTDFSSIDTAP